MANEITDDMLRKAFNADDKALGLDKLDPKKALENIKAKVRAEIQNKIQNKVGEEAHQNRLKGETGGMGRGGGGGGGMKPDTDITASKKLPKMAKGGSVSSASKRADGCAMRGKTKGRMI
jgi:hypothetical protein